MQFLTVIEAADSTACTTLADVRSALEIVSTDATEADDDARIERAIRSVSALIESVIGRRIARERVRELLPGSDTVHLVLSRRPVATVHAIAIDGQTVDLDDVQIDGEAGLLYRQTGWPFAGVRTLEVDRAAQYTQGEPTISVEYSAGWFMPGHEPEEEIDLPEDIQAAAIDAISMTLAGRVRDPGIVSEKLGDAAFTYAQRPGGARAQLAEALAAYINPVIM